MMLKKLIFIATLVVAFAALGFSQSVIKPRVNGLEVDSVYMSLLKKEAALKKTEDSISRIVNIKRAEFSIDSTNRSVKGNEIIRLESELFYVKNNIGIVASKTNAIEQEFLIKNIRSNTDISAPQKDLKVTTNYPNLVSNSYFKDNLPHEEYSMIARDNSRYKLYVSRFLQDYTNLEKIVARYNDIKTPAKADSVYTEYRTMLSKIKTLEDSLSSNWDRDFNDRIYVYSYLLDKLDMKDKLNELNQKGKDIKLPGAGVMSESFAKYPNEASFVIDYELTIAKILGFDKAVDSLNREQKNMDTLNLALPKITIERREFVKFENATILLPAVYNAKNPIPDIDIPNHGTYYSIVLGTFPATPAMSTFKGATPLYKERQKNSSTRYFAGLYESLGDVLEGVEKLKKETFKNPEPVVWQNGVYRNLKAEVDGNIGLFRVEIEGVGASANDQMKEDIARYAKKQELTRVENIYYVGVFTNKLLADELCDALNKIVGLTAKVVNLDAK